MFNHLMALYVAAAADSSPFQAFPDRIAFKRLRVWYSLSEHKLKKFQTSWRSGSRASVLKKMAMADTLFRGARSIGCRCAFAELMTNDFK